MPSQFSCIDYPDGLLLQTRESQSFLVLSGIQTQSSRVYNLVNELAQMQAMGVDVARISPQAQHTEHVIALFDRVRTHELGPEDGLLQMREWMPDHPCNGYWNGKPGLDQVA